MDPDIPGSNPTTTRFFLLFFGSGCFTGICDGICDNRPHCTRYRNRDSAMNDVIEVWSRSGENLEAIACIVLEIQSLDARRVG